MNGVKKHITMPRYTRREQLAAGSKSSHKGSHNEKKSNTTKNYGILMKKGLEGTRELTTHEDTDRWVGRPHMVVTHGDLSHVGL